MWFNLPYSVNAKINIGKILLSLLKKHFPKKNKLHKIFNKNNIKISYSCMSNISSIIAGHNKSLLQPKITKYGCDCRVKSRCSSCSKSVPNPRFNMSSRCWKWSKRWKNIYFGLAATTFKERFGNQKKDFNQKHHSKSTESFASSRKATFNRIFWWHSVVKQKKWMY